MFRSKRSSLLKRLWKLGAHHYETHGANEKHGSSSSSSSSSPTSSSSSAEDLELKAVAHSLLKHLKESQLNMLLHALESKGGETTDCVLLPKGDLKLGRRTVAPHVLCCRLFRWPAQLKSHCQLKRLPCCSTAPRGDIEGSSSSSSAQQHVCCNPHHWSLLLDPEFPPISVLDSLNADGLPFQRVLKSSGQLLPETVSTETGLTPTHYRQDSYDCDLSNQSSPPGSPPPPPPPPYPPPPDDNNTHGSPAHPTTTTTTTTTNNRHHHNNAEPADINSEDDNDDEGDGEGGGGGGGGRRTTQTDNHQHHHHNHHPPHHHHPHHHNHPQHWCSIAYWEQRERVGRLYVLREPSLNVFQRLPHGSGMCLELLQQSSSTTSSSSSSSSSTMSDSNSVGGGGGGGGTGGGGTERAEAVRKTREKIGLGLILSKEGRSVWAYNRSQFPLFVNSPTLEEANCKSLVVWKLLPGYSLRLFDLDRLEALQRTRDPGLSDGPYDPWSVRVSFAKGWGPCYSRQFVTSCPCWLEILLKETKR